MRPSALLLLPLLAACAAEPTYEVAAPEEATADALSEEGGTLRTPPYGYVLRNATLGGCDDLGSLHAEPGEDHHRYGGRLVNDAAHSLWIDEVVYDMNYTGTPMAHTVELSRISGTVPDATPTVLASGTVSPVGTGMSFYQPHSFVPLTPILLAPGESLVVSIEMRYGDDINFLANCRDVTTDEANWWSNAAAPPYAWAELGPAFGVWGDITVRAFGSTERQYVIPRDAFDLGSQLTVGDLPDEGLFETLEFDPPGQYTSYCSTTLNWKALRWTAPHSGWYTFHTLDSEMDDTVIAVLDDLGWQELDCADDAVQGVPSRASLDRYVHAGEQLTLIVGGDKDLSGLLRLDILAQ